MLKKKPTASRPSSPERGPAAAGREVFVDTAPRRVVVEEEYFLDQEVSEHHKAEWGRKPSRGTVEWQVPYDGPALGRIAGSRRRTRRLLRQSEPAVVGRLAVTDHDDTDLARVARLTAQQDSVALTLPPTFGDSQGGENLATGRFEAAGRMEYHPAAGRPELLPVNCTIEIEDPDSVFSMRSLSAWDVVDPEALSQTVAQKLMEHAAFRGGLELRVDVGVTVDVPRRRTVDTPVVRRVRVELPHLTSTDPGSLKVLFDGRREPFQHHAPSRTVEWRDMPTTLEEEHADERGSDVRRHQFQSGPMKLALGQPGELFDRRTLVVHAEVEMPGYLLSGTQVRLFDAAGRRVTDESLLTCRTVVHSTCTVVLDDAFARRRFSPYQSIFFDEIVPEEGRATDVMSVLQALGFDVTSWDLTEYASPPDTLLWLFRAERNEGPTESALAVVVRGRRAATHRRSQQGTEHQYSSRLDSGELTLFIRGTTRGDVAVLVGRINELHRALRDRFRPLRSRR